MGRLCGLPEERVGRLADRWPPRLESLGYEETVYRLLHSPMDGGNRKGGRIRGADTFRPTLTRFPSGSTTATIPTYSAIRSSNCLIARQWSTGDSFPKAVFVTLFPKDESQHLPCTFQRGYRSPALVQGPNRHHPTTLHTRTWRYLESAVGQSPESSSCIETCPVL